MEGVVESVCTAFSPAHGPTGGEWLSSSQRMIREHPEGYSRHRVMHSEFGRIDRIAASSQGGANITSAVVLGAPLGTLRTPLRNIVIYQCRPGLFVQTIWSLFEHPLHHALPTFHCRFGTHIAWSRSQGAPHASRFSRTLPGCYDKALSLHV